MFDEAKAYVMESRKKQKDASESEADKQERSRIGGMVNMRDELLKARKGA
jgi:hypothetical protein